jgi:hypothetical protein
MTSAWSAHSSLPRRASGSSSVNSGCPSTSTSSDTEIVRTSPRTTVESPSSLVLCTVHSMATGDAATRGGRTVVLGSMAMSSAAASLCSGSNRAAELLTSCSRGAGARLMTNSPVARTLRKVSFLPTEENCTIGGRAQATV